MDRRFLKVYCDHAQDRLTRPRINFTLLGWDFIDGTLSGTWVNPVTGKLQYIPNSEEPEYQTQDTGRFAKTKLASGVKIDANSPVLEFVEFKADEGMVGIKTLGTNDAGCGFVTSAPLAQDTGYTATVYAYGQGTDQDGVLLEMFWANDQNLTGGGVGIKAFLDGRLEIYKDDASKPVYKGSFTGGGYTPGTVRGGSYARATDEYVMIRVEAAGQFLTITSSRGGVVQYKPYWIIDRYNDDGTPLPGGAAQPLLPAKKWGWYVPKGSVAIIAAPVVYGFPEPYALSETYSFAEVPTESVEVGDEAVDDLTGRVLPYSENVLVELVNPEGTGPYVRTSRDFKAKVTFTGPAFVNGVVGSYPRIAGKWLGGEQDPTDLTEWIVSCTPLECQDGPEGTGVDLVLRGDCPIPFIDEMEFRPFQIVLDPHPDDPDAPASIVLLDGVGEAPEWVDGFEPASQSIHIRIWDRMALVRSAKWRETVVFDGMPLCCPPSDAAGESVVALFLREGGLRNFELESLPRIENQDGSLYVIDDTPAQIAGEWNFAAKARQLVEDSLIEAFDMAPNYAWGLKPTVNGTRAYAVDVNEDEDEAATFYRLPEDAALDPDYEANELGAWPMLYFRGHTRLKLPKEGNVVRVNGRDPGTNQWLQAFIKDLESSDPSAANGPDKLGVPREVFRRFQALTTQAAVNAVARSLAVAISKRQYTHRWPAFMRFKPDGSPVWRGDMVVLKNALRDGSDAKIRVSGFSVNLQDENGGGLMDETGRLAPVSIRLTDYSGGAICGNGGATAWQIARLQRERVKDGGVQYGLLEARQTGMGKSNDLT